MINNNFVNSMTNGVKFNFNNMYIDGESRSMVVPFTIEGLSGVVVDGKYELDGNREEKNITVDIVTELSDDTKSRIRKVFNKELVNLLITHYLLCMEDMFKINRYN